MLAEMAVRRNNIPDILRDRGMTVYRLSKITQLPHHQVNRIVKSERIPDGIEYKTLRILAEALKVSLDELEIEE
jgi:hypothetical protein